MIPLATINLALGALKAFFEFLLTPEGQKFAAEARDNRAKIAEWFAAPKAPPWLSSIFK